jgi:hypothetical protein
MITDRPLLWMTENFVGFTVTTPYHRKDLEDRLITENLLKASTKVSFTQLQFSLVLLGTSWQFCYLIKNSRARRNPAWRRDASLNGRTFCITLYLIFLRLNLNNDIPVHYCRKSDHRQARAACLSEDHTTRQRGRKSSVPHLTELHSSSPHISSRNNTSYNFLVQAEFDLYSHSC